MSSFNQITLLGNCTRDPEMKYLQSGTAICEFGLAVSEKCKDKSGQTVEEVCFIDVTAFNRTAEIANEYLSKGSSVLVSGRLKFEQWEKEGVKRSKHKVTCDKLTLVGSKRGEHDQSRDEDYSQAPKPQAPAPPADEDSPF